MMRAPILVVGRSGQLASALARAFSDRVTCFGREEIDLATPAQAYAAVKERAPRIVVNAAAYTAVDKAEQELDLATRINCEGVGALARACAELDACLVHVSTDYVFDGAKADPYRDTDPVCPLGAYGRSKAEGEARIAASGCNSAVVRTSWVYGPVGANFVRTMLRLAESREEVAVVADQRGAPTHVDDLAAACIALADGLHLRDGAAEGVFHFTNAGAATWAELAEATFEAAKIHGLPHARVKRIATADYPAPARRPANSRLDCSRIAAFGVPLSPWRPRVDACVAAIRSAQA